MICILAGSDFLWEAVRLGLGFSLLGALDAFIDARMSLRIETPSCTTRRRTTGRCAAGRRQASFRRVHREGSLFVGLAARDNRRLNLSHRYNFPGIASPIYGRNRKYIAPKGADVPLPQRLLP